MKPRDYVALKSNGNKKKISVKYKQNNVEIRININYKTIKKI